MYVCEDKIISEHYDTMVTTPAAQSTMHYDAMVMTPVVQNTIILWLMHLPNHKSPHLECCLLSDGGDSLI